MLTEQEMEVIRCLEQAWNKYVQLECQHPNDGEQFCHAIHVCQHLVMIRQMRRIYPEQFPSYDEQGNKIKYVKVEVTEQELARALETGEPIEREVK